MRGLQHVEEGRGLRGVPVVETAATLQARSSAGRSRTEAAARRSCRRCRGGRRAGQPRTVLNSRSRCATSSGSCSALRTAPITGAQWARRGCDLAPSAFSAARPDANGSGEKRPALHAAGAVGDGARDERVAERVQLREPIGLPVRRRQKRQGAACRLAERAVDEARERGDGPALPRSATRLPVPTSGRSRR